MKSYKETKAVVKNLILERKGLAGITNPDLTA